MKYLQIIIAVQVAVSCAYTGRNSHRFGRRSASCLHLSQSNEGSSAVDTSSDVIATRLGDALEKMNKVMQPDFFLGNPALKQLYTKGTKNVRVQTSSISDAGLGLFATKNIKAGSIVSFYPAHALGFELEDGRQLWLSSNEADRIHFAANPSSTSSYLHATDQPIFRRKSLLDDIDDSPIYLDANPNRKPDELWLSHYINDGAIVQSNDQHGIEEYYTQTRRRKNCIHLPFGPSPVMATVATKKIKKGEEIFTSYGCVYWLGVLFAGQDSETPEMSSQIQTQIRESAKVSVFSSEI